MAGDDADLIKKSLNGDGELIFNDGAVKGIDLPGMVRDVKAKFVGTLKGQGDTKERSGAVVPVLVAGTFSSPTFRPDLAKMLKQVDIAEVVIIFLACCFSSRVDLKHCLMIATRSILETENH